LDIILDLYFTLDQNNQVKNLCSLHLTKFKKE